MLIFIVAIVLQSLNVQYFFAMFTTHTDNAIPHQTRDGNFACQCNLKEDVHQLHLHYDSRHYSSSVSRTFLIAIVALNDFGNMGSRGCIIQSIGPITQVETVHSALSLAVLATRIDNFSLPLD